MKLDPVLVPDDSEPLLILAPALHGDWSLMVHGLKLEYQYRKGVSAWRGVTDRVEGEDDLVADRGGDDVGVGAADGVLVADEVVGRQI